LLQRELVATRGEETAGFTERFTLELEGAEAVTRLVAQRNGLKYVMKVSKNKNKKCFSPLPPLPLMHLKY